MTQAELGIWISASTLILGIVIALAKGFQGLGRLDARVFHLEENRAQDQVDRKRDLTELEAMLGALRGQMALFGETVTAVRLHAAENYVSSGHMDGMERKLDTLGDRTGKIEACQSEHGAILKSVQDNIADIKRALERRV